MRSKPRKKTGAMTQYEDIKQNFPDTIVFFQLGDFYEAFNDDAKSISKVLNITLTSRSMGAGSTRIPLAGVPVKAIDSYLKKLIDNGYKVAIVDQLEDAKKLPSGRIVKRGVTRVVTPGTVFESSILDDTINNFMLSLVINERKKNIGISLVDISTGEFLISEINNNVIERFQDEFTRFNPKEIIMPETTQKGSLQQSLENVINLSSNSMISPVNETLFNLRTAKDTLLDHFSVQSLAGFGCESMEEGIRATGAVISHLAMLKPDFPSNLTSLKLLDDSSSLILDANTQRNLEIIGNAFDGRVAGSLLSVYSDIHSSTGARLLRRWLLQPLRDIQIINDRLDAVELFVSKPDVCDHVNQLISSLSDFPRLISKIKYHSANGRDLSSLMNSLNASLEIQLFLSQNELVCDISHRIVTFESTDLITVKDLIGQAIHDDPPIKITEGGIIKPEYHEELFELYTLKTNQKTILHEVEIHEQNRTSFNIKLGYNSVHGYYIEATKAQLRDAGEDAVPSDYSRRQTLVSAERFITPRLKEIEEKILNLDEKIIELEYNLFCDIRDKISETLTQVKAFSDLLAELDVLTCFAATSLRNKYCRPKIIQDSKIKIQEGRHAVVEHLQHDTGFVPNSINMEEGELHIITGPNMSGKSTLIRQVALMVLMAQTGSWVPAQSFEFGIVDKIFTRVGAFDRLAFGQSTFMLEMLETSHILHNATKQSLVILDEVGRGTSTYDGLSLAWAVAEHIVLNIKCKTLFATHYHQLSELVDRSPDVKNFHLTAKERNGELMLLYKIQQGATDHSFGISVAKMAGVPQSVIYNAQKKLLELESISQNKPINKVPVEKKGQPRQLSLAEAFSQNITKDKYEEELKSLKFTVLAFLKSYTGIDVNYKTPIEALKQLEELVVELKKLEQQIKENFENDKVANP
ncbi:MAG: DNA mismatch repair protein MutS [Candidatus Hodarchaeales archaeon]|jgi:DNA mismatch repair protein MutS